MTRLWTFLYRFVIPAFTAEAYTQHRDYLRAQAFHFA